MGPVHFPTVPRPRPICIAACLPFESPYTSRFLIINTLFLYQVGLYEFNFSRDRPYFCKENVPHANLYCSSPPICIAALSVPLSSHQRIAKGAGGKGPRQKSQKSSKRVKSFSTLFDNFRVGKKSSKIVKKCQKVFRHFSTIFARHLFSGPFCNPLISGKEREILQYTSHLHRSTPPIGIAIRLPFVPQYFGKNVGAFRGPHSSYQRVVQGKCPFQFVLLNGVVCSNTLFSNTSALTSSLLFWGNSTCKILEHLFCSNTSGFQFWGPLA